MKYKSQSLEGEIVNSIYDFLAENSNFLPFKRKNISDGFVDALKGEMEFDYTVDEIYYLDGVKRVEPKSFHIKIKMDLFPKGGEE